MRDFIKDTLRALQYSAYGLDAANLSKKCIKLLIEDDAYWNKIKAIVTEAYRSNLLLFLLSTKCRPS